MRSGSLLNSNIGDYRLVDFLGAGGMGEVYRAVHSKIGKVVAIKVLTQQMSGGGLSERFINEARIQGRLHHQGIATLFDYSEVCGYPCIVMEYVGGQTLEECIRANGSLPLAHALRIFQAVAEAIVYVHAHAIVHRDIKSNNIKLGPDGEVKLLDFGIAKSESSPNLTSNGNVIGTFQYMSPEQLKGRAADARSDIWALGILLYEMISGQLPFQAETIGSLFEQIQNGSYLRPTALDTSTPKEVEAVIARCLRKRPEQRYQTVGELLEEIRRVQALFIKEGEESTPSSFPRARSRVKLLAALGVLALMSVAIFYAAASRETSQPEIQRTTPTATVAGGRSPAAAGDFRSVKVQSLEGEAEVYRNNERVGMTPYELKERLGERVELILKRKGFVDKKVQFSVTESKKEYTISLEREIEPE